MKLSYDPKHNVAYICFHEKPAQATTIKISDDVNVDIAPDGTVYGVELLNANEQLTGDHGARSRVLRIAPGDGVRAMTRLPQA